MREILFRGKRLDNGELVFGYLIEGVKGRKYIVGKVIEFNNDYFNTEFWYEVDPKTVGKFTNLLDINGNEIYQGDKVRWGMNGLENPVRVATVIINPDIIFISNVGAFHYGNFAYKQTNKYLEVIGNIFDEGDCNE